MFELVASLVANWRRAATVIAVWAVTGAIIILTAPPLSDVTSNNQEDFLPDGSESLRTLELIREKFPRGQGVPAIVVFHRPEGLTETDISAVEKVTAVLQDPNAPPEIESVLALDRSPELSSALRAPDGKTVTAILSITGSPAEDRFGEVVGWIREQTRSGTAEIGLTVALTGPAGIISDAVAVRVHH